MLVRSVKGFLNRAHGVPNSVWYLTFLRKNIFQSRPQETSYAAVKRWRHSVAPELILPRRLHVKTLRFWPFVKHLGY